METTGQEKVKEKFLPSKKFLNHGKLLPKTDSFCSKKTRIFSSKRAWRTLDEDFQKNILRKCTSNKMRHLWHGPMTNQSSSGGAN